VLEIVSHPEVQPLIADELLYWWDPLAAMSAVHPGHVEFTAGRVDVVVDGPSAGRTVLSPAGAAAPVRHGGRHRGVRAALPRHPERPGLSHRRR
jgi:inosine-uridine nucleoside N-ribohydrolase